MYTAAEPKKREPSTLKLDPNAARYIPETLTGYVKFNDNERRRWKHQLLATYHPTKNSWDDAVCHMGVVDLLMKLRADDTIRARNLATILNYTCPQILWDPYVVGRILTELVEFSEENWPDPNDQAIVRARDAESNWYRINQTHTSWMWLRKLRDQIGYRAMRQIEAERGLRDPDPGSPWSGLDTRPA